MKLSQIGKQSAPEFAMHKVQLKKKPLFITSRKTKISDAANKEYHPLHNKGENKEIRSIIEWYIYVKANTSTSHLILCF